MSGFRLKIPECEALPDLTNLKSSSNGKCFFSGPRDCWHDIIDCLPHTSFLVVAVIPEDTPGKTSSTGVYIFAYVSFIFLSLFFQNTHTDTYSPVWMHTAASIHFKWPVFQCDKCAEHIFFIGWGWGGWVWCQNRSLGIFVDVYALLKCIYFS